MTHDEWNEMALDIVRRIDHVRDRRDELTAQIYPADALAKRDNLTRELEYLHERLCEIVRAQSTQAERKVVQLAHR
jgi:uncharacterized coiled-coil DUF342 family protein